MGGDDRLGLVREHVAAVLGHDAQAIDPGRTFKDLGFDSLTAVELRNRLKHVTGLGPARDAGLRPPDPRRLAPRSCARAWRASRPPRPTTRRRRTRSDEPIAIVGMSCRYPGDVRLARRPVAAGQRAPRRDQRVPGRPRLGPRAPVRPGPGPCRAPATRATAASCTTRATSTPTSSGSARARRWPWTRSSGCCWRPAGRRSSARASSPPRCAAAGPACSRARAPRATRRASRPSWKGCG